MRRDGLHTWMDDADEAMLSAVLFRPLHSDNRSSSSRSCKPQTCCTATV